MGRSINCIYNEEGSLCTNKNIPKLFFGLGARFCREHSDRFYICDIKVKRIKPPRYGVRRDEC